VIIATRDSNIGMGGPAMVEGGGLGVFRPEQIGPSRRAARQRRDRCAGRRRGAGGGRRPQYLGFFQGRVADWLRRPDRWPCASVVPENRLRVYDSRAAMAGLVDAAAAAAAHRLRLGIHTALGRIEGRPVGLMANNPLHLGGAIDADAADKAARFMQLCNAHGLPLVSLVDTPGFMVGPDIEEQAQVRHVSRMFM
jgi:acetyl-CoA carboxylase carboxyltransferase component